MRVPSRSLRVFLWLAGYLVLVKLILTTLPGVFRSPAQAKVFEWPLLALWTALGGLGAFLSERTGFAPPWEKGSARSRLLGPALWGLALGVLAVATDAATGWAKGVADRLGQPSIHIPFPASLLIYPGGAILVEILYRLFPIPTLLWLFTRLPAGRKHENGAFWTLAALTSFLEPLGDLGLRSQGMATMAAVFAQDYALNFAQAWMFRKRGFLAAIAVRVAFYLVWHVLWGLAGTSARA
jgi:hypothetical protein